MLTQTMLFSFRRTLVLCTVGSCLFSPLALAADAAPGTTAATQANSSSSYKTDVARCKSGQTNQDEATCLKEAGAALEEARRNRLGEGATPAQRKQNALDRCNALTATERQDCLTQMSGVDTKTEGSIGQGGILRETVIPVPGPSGGTTNPSLQTTTPDLRTTAPGVAAPGIVTPRGVAPQTPVR